MKLTVCLSCEGRGWVTESGKNWVQSRNCEKCHGTGTVEVPDEVDGRLKEALEKVKEGIRSKDEKGILYWRGFWAGVKYALRKENLE